MTYAMWHMSHATITSTYKQETRTKSSICKSLQEYNGLHFSLWYLMEAELHSTFTYNEAYRHNSDWQQNV